MSVKLRFDADSAKWFPERPIFPELDRWLAGDNSLCRCVKQNSKRRVYELFKSPGAAPYYYLKHDRPNKMRDILRLRFRSKVLQEFSTLKLLNEKGVAAVIPLACGQSRGQGILLTLALAGSVTVDILWPKVRENDMRRARLLNGLSNLLRDLISANIFHPDLHFGNILAVEEASTTRCALVDVYGVRIIRKLSQRDKMSMLRFIAGVAQDISVDEAQSFLQPLFPEVYPEHLENIWQRLKLSMVRQMRHKWSGRRHKLINSNGNSNSICSLIEDKSGTWRWRTGFDLTLAREAIKSHQEVTSKSPKFLLKESDKERISRVEAGGHVFIVKEFLRPGRCWQFASDCHSWLCNWRLGMFGLAVPQYLAWLRAIDKTGYLVVEYIQGVSLDVALSEADDAERRLILDKLITLITHLYTLRIVHNGLNAQNIILYREQNKPRLYLIDNDRVLFNQWNRDKHWQRNLLCLAKTIPKIPGLEKEFSRLF